jgi:FdhD protein
MHSFNRSGIYPARYVEYKNGSHSDIEGGVIEEALACISVNGQEIATFMCSPMRLDELAIGFLRAEGFIHSFADVRSLHISQANCIDVWLGNPVIKPERSIITTGCGGGITFDDLSQKHAPLASSVTISPATITGLMRQLMLDADIYNHVRGVHTSALSDRRALIFMAEDVGRHNTITRLWGQALRDGVATTDCMLLTSGRVSSEMLYNAMKMGVPIVISRTSPTSLSVALAQAWGLTLIGYCRGRNFRVYTGLERVK